MAEISIGWLFPVWPQDPCLCRIGIPGRDGVGAMPLTVLNRPNYFVYWGFSRLGPCPECFGAAPVKVAIPGVLRLLVARDCGWPPASSGVLSSRFGANPTVPAARRCRAAEIGNVRVVSWLSTRSEPGGKPINLVYDALVRCTTVPRCLRSIRHCSMCRGYSLWRIDDQDFNEPDSSGVGRRCRVPDGAGGRLPVRPGADPARVAGRRCLDVHPDPSAAGPMAAQHLGALRFRRTPIQCRIQPDGCLAQR
jgi:hypothetical protein